MSKSRLLRAANTVARATDLGASSSGYLVSVWRPLRRQSRQSRALWRCFAALAVLAVVRISYANSSRPLRIGGAYRDRTDDLMLAKQPLSQLS